MKHNVKVTFLLLGIFILAQVVGLLVLDQYLVEDGLPLNIERPDLAPETSFLSLFIIILVGTGLALLLLKFKLFRVWKFWFLLSVFLTLMISFNAFIPEWLAIILAIILALWKVFRPNPYVHNFTEIFIYGALAVIFVPLLNIWSVLILLALISIYDYIAVRKTKHMVSLAKSQGESKVFAGLFVPYGKDVAILGGGDIGFPLLFSGVVMSMFNLGVLDWRTYIIPLCVTLLLAALFFKGEKKKYYPAMPYVSLGCILGLGILLLVL